MKLIEIGSRDGADLPLEGVSAPVRIEIEATLEEARAVAQLFGEEIMIVLAQPAMTERTVDSGPTDPGVLDEWIAAADALFAEHFSSVYGQVEMAGHAVFCFDGTQLRIIAYGGVYDVRDTRISFRTEAAALLPALWRVCERVATK